MKTSEKNQLKIYQFMDDSPAFSVCNLNGATHPGDCCNPISHQENWLSGGKITYYCGDSGIHFHCPRHTKVRLYRKKVERSSGEFFEGYEYGESDIVWWCDKCEAEDKGYSGCDFDEKEQIKRARAFATSKEYEDAQICRIDDQVVQIEFKKARVPKGESDYYSAWGNIETDKDGNPQLNLYIALKSMGGKKAHYFVEPELGRLREEVRGMDIDPGEIISKIEVTTRRLKINKTYAANG